MTNQALNEKIARNSLFVLLEACNNDLDAVADVITGTTARVSRAHVQHPMLRAMLAALRDARHALVNMQGLLAAFNGDAAALCHTLAGDRQARITRGDWNEHMAFYSRLDFWAVEVLSARA